jgi:hypothetical protein
MSLDVYLLRERQISYDDGTEPTKETEILYDANITHNLNVMAEKAGIYEALWRPYQLKEDYNIPEGDNVGEFNFEEENTVIAKEIIPVIEKGLKDLKERPEYFEQFNSPNGWGMYHNFVPWVERYLEALKEYPKAKVEVSR